MTQLFSDLALTAPGMWATGALVLVAMAGLIAVLTRDATASSERKDDAARERALVAARREEVEE